MTQGLRRYQETGDLHFVTFSCFRRNAFLSSPQARDLIERALETMRVRYDFYVSGYVVMPEHVHLLVSEPRVALLGKALQALKLSVAVKREERPFWQTRYYDFNVFTREKRLEKLRYMNENPVARGLVGFAENWQWSSARHYATGEAGVVEVASEWTARGRGFTGASI